MEESAEEENLPVINLEELAKHNTETDCWMAVRGEVFNMTLRLRPVDGRPEHPGGWQMLKKWAGQDITDEFLSAHFVWEKTDMAKRMAPGIVVARLQS